MSVSGSEMASNKTVSQLTESLALAMGAEQGSHYYLIPMKPGEHADHFQFAACTCHSCADTQNRDLTMPYWSTVLECYAIVQSIRNLEEAQDAADILEDLGWKDEAQCMEKAKQFLDWVQKNGGDTSKIVLKLVRHNTGFGVFPSENMLAKETIFFAPPKLNMTNEFAEYEREILPMEDITETKAKGVSSSQVIRADIMRTALFLLHEKYVVGEKSFWKTFIDVMSPLHASVDRITFSLEELELLKECWSFFRDTWMDVKLLLGEYIFFHQVLFPKNASSKLINDLKSVITFRRYMWARARAGYYTLRSSEAKRRYSIVVEEPWDVGIFPITDMALNPLVTPSPENDEYNLILGICNSDANFERKATILAGMNLSTPQLFCITAKMLVGESEPTPSQKVLDQLVSYVRIIQCNEELLNRVDSVGTGFLAEPRRETWLFLSGRFKLLENGVYNATNNLFLKWNIAGSTDAAKTFSNKRLQIMLCMAQEHCALASLFAATEHHIDN